VIPHSKPFIGKEEIEAAASVIASGQLAQGPKVGQLEEEWCRLTKKKNAAAVGSGVAALRLGLLSLGIGSGDRVVVPAYTCVALLNAVLALNAEPVLADVEPDRWTLCNDSIRKKLDKRVKAVIAVHLFGTPCDLSELLAMGIPVIEDCAHAVNGPETSEPFGSRGVLNIGSFYATKLVGAGEGGIVASDEKHLINRIIQARNYDCQQANGSHLNDKLTDIEAAIAGVQLRKISEILSLRAARAKRYGRFLKELEDSGRIVLPQDRAGRAWYRYAVRLTDRKAEETATWMAKREVYIDQPVWDLRSSPYWTEDLKGGSMAFDRVVSLPLYPDLTESQQDTVCRTLTEYLKGAA
jgi:perosamine synthetase